MAKISELPFLNTANPNAYLPVVDPAETDPALQNKRILISSLTTGGGENDNFAPWDIDQYYSNAGPDFVEDEGNIWKALNTTAAKGNKPSISPTFWQLASSGELTHQQNTDTFTTSRVFEIGKALGTILDSDTGLPIEEPTGEMVLVFGKANDNTNKIAIRKYWETIGGFRYNYLQKCLSYTGTGSDVWEDIGGGGASDAADISYTPADATWWAPILSGSVTVVKEAMDWLAEKVKELQASVSGKADKTLTINTQTANYTLVLADAAAMIRMNVATANTLTVPPNSSVAFPVGTQLFLSQAGAGQTTIVPGSGVTLNNFGNKFKLAGQYAGATLIKVATNTWNVYGTTIV